jgi:hypothetical protein
MRRGLAGATAVNAHLGTTDPLCQVRQLDSFGSSPRYVLDFKVVPAWPCEMGCLT